MQREVFPLTDIQLPDNEAEHSVKNFFLPSLEKFLKDMNILRIDVMLILVLAAVWINFIQTHQCY